jgi:hypothetical protein
MTYRCTIQHYRCIAVVSQIAPLDNIAKAKKILARKKLPAILYLKDTARID